MRLASPLFKERKHSICEKKKRNPSKDPKKINSNERLFFEKKG